MIQTVFTDGPFFERIAAKLGIDPASILEIEIVNAKEGLLSVELRGTKPVVRIETTITF